MACSSSAAPDGTDRRPSRTSSDDAGGADATTSDVTADVIAVEISGPADRRTFRVTVRSPDTGCEQYADWWEVLDADGRLLVRRILAHSHVDEQPFVRSGGPVDIADGRRVFVRAHMNEGGYGGQVMAGSLPGPFAPTAVPAGFAADVEREPPQPSGCAF
jgi:hypothetical protein